LTNPGGEHYIRPSPVHSNIPKKVMNKKIFTQIVQALPPNAKILDAGCGSGNNSRLLYSIRKDLRIWGVDIDSAHKKAVPEYVQFVQASVTDLKRFKSGTFDAIACFHLVEHLPHPEEAIQEFQRVLKKDGVLFAEAPHWICAVTPIGTNFWDDPTHLRPHSKASFAELFKRFTVEYLKVEPPIMFFLADLYQVSRFSFRQFLGMLGLYKIAVFLIAKNTNPSKN